MSSRPIAGCLGKEVNSHLAITFFQAVVEHDKESPELPLLQAKPSQLPQLLLTEPAPQTPPQLFCPSPQHFNVIPEFQGLEPDPVLEMQPHQCQVQKDNPCPGTGGLVC